MQLTSQTEGCGNLCFHSYVYEYASHHGASTLEPKGAVFCTLYISEPFWFSVPESKCMWAMCTFREPNNCLNNLLSRSYANCTDLKSSVLLRWGPRRFISTTHPRFVYRTCEFPMDPHDWINCFYKHWWELLPMIRYWLRVTILCSFRGGRRKYFVFSSR
jgi:hypothetical protein